MKIFLCSLEKFKAPESEKKYHFDELSLFSRDQAGSQTDLPFLKKPCWNDDQTPQRLVNYHVVS